MELKAWTNRHTPITAVYIAILLFIISPSMGSILNWRQEESTSSASITATTASAESVVSSASVSGTGSASGTQSSASSSGSPDRPVLASPTSSTTEASSTTLTATSSALNSSATDNSTLTEYNDPTGCHPEYDPGIIPNPFCTPAENSTIDVNATYEVTWDAKNFQAGENITITLHAVNVTADTPTADYADLLTQTVNSALGHTYINTTVAMLNGSTNATLFLFANGSENGQPQQYRGPMFYILDKANPDNNNTSSDSSSSSSSSSSKQLGEKVGIPVGLIFFLIILAALAFFLIRYRRNNAGYGTGKSLNQRMNTGSLRGGSGGGGGAAGGGSRGHKRQESFHDEPTTGGVELQDRNRGLTGEDNWDWGRDSVGSPISPVSPTGNHFRDELQRQKTVGRAS